jgi:hypothetical protein
VIPPGTNLNEIANGSWWARTLLDTTRNVEGAEKQYIDGSVYEVLIGGKSTRILGNVFETHVINKDEVIIPIEFKVNFALMLELCLLSKNEVVTAYQLYTDLGPKGHFLPKEFGLFMGNQKLLIAEARSIASVASAHISNYNYSIQTKSQNINQFEQEYTKLEEQITTLRQNVASWRAKITEAKWEASKVTRELRGKEMVNAGTWKVESKGSVKLKGGSIKWKGSSAKIIAVGGNTWAVGTKMSVKK